MDHTTLLENIYLMLLIIVHILGKCAFEDVGFKIVEEIEWVYLTGMPKNQDIGKLFLKQIEKQLIAQGVNNIQWEE